MLVPAGEIQRFAERYVAVTALASRSNVSDRSFARYLKESGMPLLAVPIPEEGGGMPFFFSKRLRHDCGLLHPNADKRSPLPI